jgi:hypothetical protein
MEMWGRHPDAVTKIVEGAGGAVVAMKRDDAGGTSYPGTQFVVRKR